MSEQEREQESERVVIRDNRKIDPETGEARKPKHAPAAAEPQAADADALLVEERTRDLQRLQAEYANYRKRAERDRLAAGDLAVGRALAQLLPVIDDIERAKVHGDLTGAFKAIADKLDFVLDKLGLEAFGAVGDPFDPSLHEAVMHDESPDVAVPTCTTVMRQGYRHGERLLRPAMVGVSDPESSTATVGDTNETQETPEVRSAGTPQHEPQETKSEATTDNPTEG